MKEMSLFNMLLCWSPYSNVSKLVYYLFIFFNQTVVGFSSIEAQDALWDKIYYYTCLVLTFVTWQFFHPVWFLNVNWHFFFNFFYFFTVVSLRHLCKHPLCMWNECIAALAVSLVSLFWTASSLNFSLFQSMTFLAAWFQYMDRGRRFEVWQYFHISVLFSKNEKSNFPW